MDTHIDPRASAPRVVDLRRARAPEVEILVCPTYDFLLSLHVSLASPDYDYADYDIGRAWIEEARARCDERDPSALTVLGRYLGDGRPGSLHASLISLVAVCPEPRDPEPFLAWLRTLPPEQFAEVLLDQDGFGHDWPELITTTLAEVAERQGELGPIAQRLVSRYPTDVQPTVASVLQDVEGSRRCLLDSLAVWQVAVFQDEIAKILPTLRREADILEQQRADMPPDRFIQTAMRGVEWQRPAGFRRVIFAPSYFCRPAVFYHFWRGALTFCTPVDATAVAPNGAVDGAAAPGEDILRFFEALGDATRLRILRLLAEREMYLTELSDRLKLTKATTKHHMVRLRASGLVTLYDRDRMTFYALRQDVSRHAAQLLDDYLKRPQPPRKVPGALG